ncbi:MAG: methyltransferase domain-containing protein [Nitrosopumilaceae archaeon]|nr:methyltransferase domain-containing protein [Nitrosopumilaceae archaeon]
MVSINPLDVFLWTFRRNEKDTINLYNTLSPVMQLATGGSMLNFGYWSPKHSDPISAQENLCMAFANLAELTSAKHVVDVGSGLSAPSHLWQQKFPDVFLYDVNINYSQLSYGKRPKIEFLNSSSTKLPFTNNSVDRVLALESAQHFKPLSDFISESKRILMTSGLLVMAIPVTLGNSSLKDLGMLKFTWSSEHYSLDDVKKIINSYGFLIETEQLIGNYVYEPLADYYVKNRAHLKKSILEKYPNYVENILYKSIIKMKNASEKRIIDYVLLKCVSETTQ